MKKIFLILTLCILVVFGYGQTRSSTPGTIPRSNQTIVVEDGNLSARNSLLVPRFTDTTQANTYTLIDTLGRIIYTTNDQSFWGRTYSGGKKWAALGSGGGGSGTVTNIATGLGLSGGPITTTGTLLVDTASASILSRQRAAATYALIGSIPTIYTTITYAQLQTAIAGSTLTPGTTYKITNRGDRGLFFKAIAVNEISKTGQRLMLCPTYYGVGANSGHTWIGVWNSAKSVSINNLAIWGGLVFRNLTGSIGTATSEVLLDVVNWVVVTKAGFVSSEYTQKQFGVSYDVTNDWIERQWDGAGNVFGIDYATEQASAYGFNMCDVSDWNYASSGDLFTGNQAIGCYNNSTTGEITRNIVKYTISRNGNDGFIQDNNIGGGLDNNSNNGDIQDNILMDGLSDNSNDGDIRFNTNGGSITNNSNDGNINRNKNNGVIEGNSNVGGITDNQNNGDIINCSSGATPCNITLNLSTGDITGVFSANVSQVLYTGPVFFQNNSENWLQVDPNNGLISLLSRNSTGSGNLAGIDGATSSTETEISLVADFDGGAKSAAITAFADVSTATIEYTADTHNFTGNVLPTTDNTYTLGDATHRWSSIHVMGSSIKLYGSSSGVITLGTQAASGTYNFTLPTTDGNASEFLQTDGSGVLTWAAAGSGTVTSVAQSFTGGLISVGGSPVTTSGTLALTVAGTSGGIPYFSSSSAWASSAALAANALVIGGGAGVAPSTTTTGTGILTFLGTPSSANLLAALTDETGTGKAVFATSPTFTTSILLAGSTSGNVTINSDALSNALNATTLSGAGVVGATMFSRLTGDFTMSNVNTEQPVFGTTQDVWTLRASTTYYFEGMYYLTHGTTSHTLAMSFPLAGGASVTSIFYTTLLWTTTANTLTTAQYTTLVNTTASTVIDNAGTFAAEVVTFSGYISVNAGGTVTPSITFSADPTGTILSKTGGFIRFTPVGTNTVSTLGNVN